MEKAPQLLASDPTIARAGVPAGKVDVAALEPQPPIAAGGGLVVDASRLRALTNDELIRRHDAA